MEKIRGLMNRIGEFADKIERYRYSDDFTQTTIYNFICGLIIAGVVIFAAGGMALLVVTIVKGPMILAPVIGLVTVAIISLLLSFSKAIGFD